MNQSKRIFLVLSILSLVLLLIGQKLGGRQGLLFAFLISIAANTLIYYYADIRILNMFKNKPIEGNDPWDINLMLRELSHTAKLPVPKIYSTKLESPTAITIGKSWTQSSILVSEKLLEKLSKDELKAVLALELAKIKRHDTLAMGMLSIFTSFWLQISQTLDSIIFMHWIFKKRIYAFTYVSLPILKVILYITIHPSTYYASDKFAVELLPNPKLLAEVIWKLESYASTIPLKVPLDTAHLFIVNPLPKDGVYKWLRIQPEYSLRIQRLVGHFPI
ncbi:MAG: M48 family metalloprotease [Bdellovibrionales bacterium]|nr:M48 family metalloprotease [Bdellovibrionales bacterium]